jgi:hypothetical protein
MKLKDLFLAFLIILIPFLNISANEGNEQLFPTGTLVKGWEIDKDLYFPGMALDGHINGGAELFYEFGFKDLNIRSYKKDKAEITVEIYRMVDSDAALGIFLIKHANTNPDKTIPVPNMVTGSQVVFTKSNYYILISSQAVSSQATEKMLDFGRYIGKKIPETKKPSDFSILPEKDRVPATERIIRGPIALQAVYPLGDQRMLWEGVSDDKYLNAYAADYSIDSRIYTYIICDYENPQSAQDGYKGILKDHDPYISTVNIEKSHLILRDWNNRYIIVIIRENRVEIFARLNKPEIPK